MQKITESFPTNYTPRPTQIEALKQIQSAIESGKKYIICSLPTGTGKSFIPATVANASDQPSNEYLNQIGKSYLESEDSLVSYKPFGCLTLTVNKTLQDQYDNLFDNGMILKGKRNYVCAVDDEFDCELGPCIVSPKTMIECKANRNCPYLNARIDTLSSKFGVLNYSMFLCLPNRLTKRQFIVCDEASEIEDELVSHYSVEIDYKKFDPKRHDLERLQTDDPHRSYEWLQKLVKVLEKLCLEYSSHMQHSGKNKRLFSLNTNLYRFHKGLYDKVNKVIKFWGRSQFLTELNENGVTFLPLKVDSFAGDIFNSGDVVILMSASIPDHFELARSLGIDDYQYIELDSTFDPKKSPIYCSSKHFLNYKNMDQVLPDLSKQAIELCNKHKDEKGIIHCHNFKVTEAIKKQVKGDSRYLFREAGVTNEHILNEHKIRKDPTILISPSMTYGISLDDDLGRFQIIMKAPYFPLGSKRIKMLFDQNKEWYTMKMLTALLQACGRCTRSEDDHSVTYILDGTITSTIKRYFKKLPLHFRSRLQ